MRAKQSGIRRKMRARGDESAKDKLIRKLHQKREKCGECRQKRRKTVKNAGNTIVRRGKTLLT